MTRRAAPVPGRRPHLVRARPVDVVKRPACAFRGTVAELLAWLKEWAP